MVGPRDPAPVNRFTGEPLSDRQAHHLDMIEEAGELLYEAMHNAEGSTPVDGRVAEHVFGSRRMQIAGSHLETALMFARKAALEAT